MTTPEYIDNAVRHIQNLRENRDALQYILPLIEGKRGVLQNQEVHCLRVEIVSHLFSVNSGNYIGCRSRKMPVFPAKPDARTVLVKALLEHDLKETLADLEAAESELRETHNIEVPEK